MGAFTYIIFCPIVIWIAKKSKAYKKLLFLGTFITGGSFLLIGPSFGLPKSIYFPYIALLLNGIGTGLIYVPVLPDLINIIEKVYPDYPESIVSDTASSIFNHGFALGYIIGTSMGGIFVTYCGFINISMYISFGIVGFSLIYLLFGN